MRKLTDLAWDYAWILFSRQDMNTNSNDLTKHQDYWIPSESLPSCLESLRRTDTGRRGSCEVTCETSRSRNPIFRMISRQKDFMADPPSRGSPAGSPSGEVLSVSRDAWGWLPRLTHCETLFHVFWRADGHLRVLSHTERVFVILCLWGVLRGRRSWSNALILLVIFTVGWPERSSYREFIHSLTIISWLCALDLGRKCYLNNAKDFS